MTCEENFRRDADKKKRNVNETQFDEGGRGLRATEHLLQEFRVADRFRRWCYPSAPANILTHSSPQGCAQKKPREQKEEEERILVSSSVVAKGTQSAFLCCDWIIILLLIHIACVCSFRGLFSEWQRAACHAAGPDKSYESCPEEPQRRSREESFSPNPGRCHCFRTRWPITHGTWTDEEEKQSLILSCTDPHFLPRPICFLQTGAGKMEQKNRVREAQRWTGTNCSGVSSSWC